LFKKKSLLAYLDTSDPAKCNWMALVRFVPEESNMRNCICYQLGRNIFFTVINEVSGGEALAVSYSPGYRALMEGSAGEEPKAPEVSHPVPVLVPVKAPLKKTTESSSSSTHIDVQSLSLSPPKNHEHDYSSTLPTTTASSPVRRSERKRKAKPGSQEGALESASPTKKIKTKEESSKRVQSNIKSKSKKVTTDPSEDINTGFVSDSSGEDYSEMSLHSSTPASQESKRKETLKRLGAILAVEEWECKFCPFVVSSVFRLRK
jgi:hypothetical protein